MANYVLTNKAVEDLTEIWNYTFDVWSETQADRYYEMLIEACQELDTEKIIGKDYPEITLGMMGLRIGQHIIFYRKINANSIEIARILHGRMDLRNRIKD
jgi:toxin ParE1/3/4